MKAEMP